MFRSITVFALACFLLSASPAAADLGLGGQLVYGDDSDIGVGARVEIDTPELVEQSRIQMDFNWYFPDDRGGADVTFWEANMNWLHQVGSGGGESAASYYLGGGLNFAYWSAGDDSEKDLGVNFLGGVVVPFGIVSGIAEVRITIAGSEQYALGVGFLF